MIQHLARQEQVAEALREVPWFQPWRLEGPVRAWLRASLCLQGAKWHNADELARKLVARARSLVNGVGAPRGWDVVEYAFGVEGRECLVCDRWFIANVEHHLYCSQLCHWRAARIIEHPVVLRRCSRCNEQFETANPQKLFCSADCRTRATYERQTKAAGYVRVRVRWAKLRALADRENADRANPRYCQECSEQLPYGCDPRKIYCSDRCNWTHNNRKNANGNGALPNGHAPNGVTVADAPENIVLPQSDAQRMKEKAASPGLEN